MFHPFDFGPLYRILECPELMSDACLCDESNTMLFLSVWGRDTAIQEFLARLTLKPSEDRGLNVLNLREPFGGNAINVSIGSIGMLEKRTARTFRRTLFGSMIHLWLLDKRCLSPDRANATALALLFKNAPDRVERLWALVKEACPLPLLDHWRDRILELLCSHNMLSQLPFLVGPLEADRLALDVPASTLALGELIRDDELTVPTIERQSPIPLQRVA